MLAKKRKSEFGLTTQASMSRSLDHLGLNSSASEPFIPRVLSSSLSRAKTAAQSQNRSTGKGESIVAPGPALDYIVPREPEKVKMTKERLIALAQECNLRRGKDANEGLEEFVTDFYAPSHSIPHQQDSKKLCGFKAVTSSPPQLLIQKQPSFSRFHRIPSPSLHKFTSQSLINLRKFKRLTTAAIPSNAAKLDRRQIMTRAANKIRAETMAAVKIFHKQKELSKLPSVCSIYSVEMRPTPAEEARLSHVAFAQLRVNLERELVDKLAAAEIENTKLIEKDALYPKLSCEQLEDKVGKLKGKAQAGWGPLGRLHNLEVQPLKNRRLKR